MNPVFDINNVRKSQVMVEFITDTGSAFAVTPQGEQVFINNRISGRMDLEGGKIYDAFLVPNYEDKRASIPWRAMRVEQAMVDPTLVKMVGETFQQQLDDELKQVKEYISECGWPITIDELADELDIPKKKVTAVLERHADQFEKVDAYMLKPENK